MDFGGELCKDPVYFELTPLTGDILSGGLPISRLQQNMSWIDSIRHVMIIFNSSDAYCPKFARFSQPIIADESKDVIWEMIGGVPIHPLEFILFIPQLLHSGEPLAIRMNLPSVYVLFGVCSHAHEDIPVLFVSDGCVSDGDLVLLHDLPQP